MLKVRTIRSSVYKTLYSFFTNSTIWTPSTYTVYGVDDMSKSVSALTAPYVFLLSNNRFLKTRHLPAVVINMAFSRASIELGNANWWFASLMLSVFGKNSAEKDDIASSIVENIETIDIYDFTTDPATISSTVQLEPSGVSYWSLVDINVPTELAVEQTLANGMALTSGFLVA